MGGDGTVRSKLWWKGNSSMTRKTLLSKSLSDPTKRLVSSSSTNLSTKAKHDSACPSPQALPWIEMEENGALYNTILKKVRYRSHTLEDLDEGDLSFKQWETIKVKQIKAASLEKLVEHLTPTSEEETQSDPGFLLAFLCTYKSFSTTTGVIDHMLNRFEFCENYQLTSLHQDEANGIVRRICSVLSIWIDQYPRDFDEPPSYNNLNRLIRFMEKRSHISSVKDLYTRCDHKLTTLTVSPFDDERPLKFKFCSCISVIGCNCKKSNSFGEDEKSFELKTFSAALIAEQLTVVDSELFLRVVPRECLAYFWSKRDPSKGSKAQSIKLTVEQFNFVTLKVTSTILNAKDKTNTYTSSARAKVISKWIDVALELRDLKNFSSLKAILSSLQVTAVYRLSCSWELVSKYSMELYEELSEIFSNDSNQKASRDLLVQEGTAKYSTNSLRKSKSKRQSWMKEGVTQGTVPYLGTFLTDLTMIDSALPDNIKENLINFEKRRKEFEIVVQIKLLQQAAKNYTFTPVEDFFTWFNLIETYTDKESYEQSLEVEPPPPKDGRKPTTPQPQRKSVSIKRYLSESDLLHKMDNVHKSLSSFSLVQLKLARHNSNPTMTDSLQSLVSRNNLKPESLSCRTLLDPSDASPLDSTGVVGRVHLEDTANIQYKAIKILPNHRAYEVISTTLIKFKCDHDVGLYSLYQVIDNKKSLHIPLNSNMYYAIHKCKELCFKVTKKKLSKKKSKIRAGSLSRSPVKSPAENNQFSFRARNEIASENTNAASISLKSFSTF